VRYRLSAIFLLLGLLFGRAASGGTLDRVRQEGIVRCGGAARPGLAFPGEDEKWYGLTIDICRAVAAAVLDDPAKFSFRGYRHDSDYNSTRLGLDEVMFLTGTDLIGHQLLDTVLPGPAVFFESFGLMVVDGSKVQRAGDLGSGGVCLEPGSEADRAIEGYFAENGMVLREKPFQEADEMLDALSDGLCGALAGEITTLAAVRAHFDAPYRILPDVAAISPVLAVTSLDDAGWSAVIAWTVATLIRAEQSGWPSAGGRLPGLNVAAPGLGLTAGWQARVIAAVGDYAAIFSRNLGEGSALRLPRGVNAPWNRGGLLTAPLAQ
jgi:general L-amino acid transport system substrate-binding protein